MTKNGRKSERENKTTYSQVCRPVEALGNSRSTFDVPGPVKDSRNVFKEKRLQISELASVDPEEDIVWNGRGTCPNGQFTSTHRSLSACEEGTNAAGSQQRHGEAKWVQLPAQNQRDAHQYSVLKNLLEYKSSEFTKGVGSHSGNHQKSRSKKANERNHLQKKGSRGSEYICANGTIEDRETTGCRYVEKSSVQNEKLNRSEKEAAIATDATHSENSQKTRYSRCAADESRGGGTGKKKGLALWIPRQGTDEGEITVSHPFSSQGEVKAIGIGRAETSMISVSNNGKRLVNLESGRLLYAKPKESFILTLISDGQLSAGASSRASKLSSAVLAPHSLPPGSCLSFQLACTAQTVGYHKAVLLFDFGRHKVLRYVNLIAEDDIARALTASEPYSRVRVQKFQSPGQFVRGPPPPAPRFAKPLGAYAIPREIERSLLEDHMLPVFLQELSFGSYQEFFSSLIYAEELQWKADIHAYDLQNATMRLDKSGCLALKVLGLLERRPSVIYRDSVLVKPLGSGKQYQGFVYGVQAEEVLLKFHASFHKNFIANQQYAVRFSYSRITIRRCLQAINASKNLAKNFLFPYCIPTARNSHIDDFVPVNRMLNKEQKESVVEILKRGGGPPYLVYGPPGTGKTVTVVEAILQTLKAKADGKILACAPSNSAADVLLDRLRGQVQVMDLLRLNAYTRPLDDVAPELWPYCYSDGNFFCCPSLDKLVKYKVVVSTYYSAAMLEAQGIEHGHFSHIFLDECGQGMEPEAMVALSSFVREDTVVVLAGDHQQLGPVIRSSLAQKYGLGSSLLERLSMLPLYSRSSGDSNASEFNKEVVTKLVRNYRSHPAILDLPSRLFYDGELIPSAPPEICNSLCSWEELRNKNFPILFIGVEGKDEREGKSPSWFNPQEASKVVEIVAKLKEYRRNRLSDNDIGIITPYNQQVKKIKVALALKNMKGIKAGSVEQFQGQERKVIIISTVRSSKNFIVSDELHQIGFLANPKRFNVAITRAKALLVIIGNPYVLSQDTQWGELLRYCLSHNSYAGCSLPEEQKEEDNKLKEYIDKAFAASEASGGDGDAASDAAFETPWPDPTC